jgi:lipoate-protein ligase B
MNVCMLHSFAESWLCVEIPAKDYPDALKTQHTLVDARVKGDLAYNMLLLLEHPPVFTLGRRGGKQSLLVSEEFLKQRNISVIQTERGGDITYHGPGQLVGYLIVNLRETKWDLKDFVECLEEMMIRTVAEWGIKAQRNPLNHGIWLGMKKLGSIGLAVRKGISFHGFSLNVSLDLQPFEWIHPCGLAGIGVDSMGNALGQKILMEDVRQAIKRNLQTLFAIDLKTENSETLLRYRGRLPDQVM